MKKTYKVTTYETIKCFRTIEADNIEEAKEKAEKGEGDFLDGHQIGEVDTSRTIAQEIEE